MSDGTGSTTWTFDSMGRVLSEQQTIGTVNKTTSNQYWFDGSIKKTTYPSGSVLSVTPGGDGRPLSATDITNNITYAESLVYAPTGQLTGGIFGNSSSYAGIVETNKYNSRGQPMQLQDCGLPVCTPGYGSQTPYLLDLSYNYGLGTNDNGNVQAITNNKNSARSQTFTYDGLNRIATAQTSSTWGINFTGGIDPWGNLIQTGTISGTATNPMVVSQQVNVKNQFTLSGYTYDAAGNVLSDGSGNTSCAGATYTWDAKEQMICALGSSYIYDGDGVRVEKTGGASTPTMYWGAGTLTESDTSGNLTSEYIFLSGRRIARRDISGGAVHYFFADMLGSNNVVATSAGLRENDSDFYPYGGELVTSQFLTNQKYKFEGKERDPESASTAQPQWLDNFGARFDSSATGRFMSPDWANTPEPVPYAKLTNPQTLNLYAFAANNPESAPDLDGHEVDTSPLPSTCDGHGALCASIRDSISGGGSIEDGVAAYDKSIIQNAKTGAAVSQSDGQGKPQTPSPAPQRFPPANLTVNYGYLLVVENDSEHVNQDDVRDVEYDLHNAPDANHPNGTILGADVKSTEISEHLSNTKDFTESSSRITGQFEDNMGPHGRGKIAGARGSISTDRYFTVAINGKQIGAVRIMDRYGLHLVDHITVDFTNDRTILNGQKGPTDVP
jgi:RHS repeat-associated protein